MNVILRNSTRRMIDQSRASIEAEGLIAWLRAEGYTDYVIDCHIRRLLFVLPKNDVRIRQLASNERAEW